MIVWEQQLDLVLFLSFSRIFVAVFPFSFWLTNRIFKMVVKKKESLRLNLFIIFVNIIKKCLFITFCVTKINGVIQNCDCWTRYKIGTRNWFIGYFMK